MVIRQHQPVEVCGGAGQRDPERGRVGQVDDRRALGSADPLDLLFSINTSAEFDVLPCQYGIGRDDLDRLVELRAESGGQVGMSGDHCVDGFAQPLGIQRAGDGDVQLYRVQLAQVAIAVSVGVEKQSLL